MRICTRSIVFEDQRSYLLSFLFIPFTNKSFQREHSGPLFYQNSPLEFIFYSTGYGNKLNDKTAEEFAKTVNFVPHQGQFKLHSVTYDREFKRHNRGPIRINTTKKDHYHLMEYAG